MGLPSFYAIVLGCMFLGSYRSRLDIIADMLRVVTDNERAKKTQIMYRANLSFKLLNKYLAGILVARLVRFDRRGSCYEITHKGKKFLEKYKNYEKHNKSLEQKLNTLSDSKKVLEKLSLGK